MVQKILHPIRKILERSRLILSTKKYRRSIWKPAKKLSHIHIRNCSVIEDRYRLLEEIPKQGLCAEIGIWKCDYSQHILETVLPRKLHLVDIDPVSTKIAKKRFKREIEIGQVEIHLQDSSTWLQSMQDETFDWIYIDGDHSYDGVRKDLEAAHLKIKPDGFITLNDYIFFGSSDLTKYGIIEAVHEFCIKYHYELIHLALNGRMYNDVTIRRIQNNSKNT